MNRESGAKEMRKTGKRTYILVCPESFNGSLTKLATVRDKAGKPDDLADSRGQITIEIFIVNVGIPLNLAFELAVT